MIAIRRAADADRVAIARLHEAAIRTFGPRAYTQEEVDSWAAGITPSQYKLEQQMVVAVDDEDVVAFGHYHDGEIAAVYVDPKHVRRGVGRQMLAKLEDVARADGATSVHLNAALNSVGFYEACGYQRAMATTYRTRGGLAIAVVVMEKALIDFAP